jgi:hypothetical protein
MGIDNRISRRDFLRLLGAGTAILTLGGMSGITDLFNPNYRSRSTYTDQQGRQIASAQQGSWSAGANTTISPIHASLLHTGKIFYLAGSGWNVSNQVPPFQARVLDINTGSEKVLEQNQDDLFCVGQTTLADGSLLLAGGTLLYDVNPDNCDGRWHGLDAAYEFDVSSEELVAVSRMAHGRWYPTLVTLPDGKVWCYNGYDEYGDINRLVEVYDPGTKSWTIKAEPGSTNTYCVGAQSSCPGAGTPCYTGAGPTTSTYPRAHLMPSGLVVINGFRTEIRSWRPTDGDWQSLGSTSTYRHYGTSFLLPLQNTTAEKGKMMVVGGSPTTAGNAVTTVQIIDFNASSTATPVVRTVSSLTYRRKYLAPVILPNGKLVVFGGSQVGVSQPVLFPEMFDPVTETWQTLPAASWPRVYHQVALLLPDGRVWVAGGMPVNGVWEARTELFSPDYLFAGARPTISGTPSVGNYGSTINISTPDGAAVTSVSLVRLMNTTHHYDANQRLVWLQIVGTSAGGITVSAPINRNIAPPGYYMIHILNSAGVPSAGTIIQIPGTATDTSPPSQVLGLTVTAAGVSQLNLTWTANPAADGVDRYNVYRGTTAGFPVTLGTTPPLATPNTNSYSNTGLSASTTYYYKVAAVDTAGNIGALSGEASGTTSGPDTTIPNLAITSPTTGSTLPPGSVLVQGTASDNTGGSGVRDVRVRVDTGAYVTATPQAPGNWSTWSITVSITATGSHTITANCRDNAGNFRTRGSNITIA